MDATEPLLRELVGAALREERRRQGLTLARLAAESGVSMQHLSDVERGQKDPSSEVLAAITGALGISVFDLGSAVALSARHAAEEVVILDLTDRRRGGGPSSAPGSPRPTTLQGDSAAPGAVLSAA